MQKQTSLARGRKAGWGWGGGGGGLPRAEEGGKEMEGVRERKKMKKERLKKKKDGKITQQGKKKIVWRNGWAQVTMWRG